MSSRDAWSGALWAWVYNLVRPEPIGRWYYSWQRSVIGMESASQTYLKRLDTGWHGKCGLVVSGVRRYPKRGVIDSLRVFATPHKKSGDASQSFVVSDAVVRSTDRFSEVNSSRAYAISRKHKCFVKLVWSDGWSVNLVRPAQRFRTIRRSLPRVRNNLYRFCEWWDIFRCPS